MQNRTYGGDFNLDNLQQSKDGGDFNNSAAANFYSQLPKPFNQLTKDNKKLLNDDLDESEHRSTTSSEEQQENLLNKNGSSYHDEYKLAFKRSLAQNSTLYNTLLNCNNLTAAVNGSATNNKSDLADISSILSVISNVTPMLANVAQDLPSLSLNDEQLAAKINQIQQQALQDQSTLLNSSNSNGTTSITPGKQNGKRSRSDRSQLNGNQSINGSTRLNVSNSKRVKRESKNNSIEFDPDNVQLSSLNSLTNLNNLTKLSNFNLKNNSLDTINNLINGNVAEDDQRSDKSTKNGSDIENEMTNGKLQQKSTGKPIKLNSSTSQQLVNSQTLEHNDTIDDEEDEVNLSEEEEANKMEQELCEQEQRELNLLKETKRNDKNDDKDEDSLSDKKDDDLANKSTEDLLKADLGSLIVPKKTTENLADLLIKSDKNNNKNMRNNNGNSSSSDLNNRVFIDPLVEDDVKLLERQLQDQQYLCKICHLEVRSVNTLRRHQRLHDAGGQLYACHYCQYTSLDKSSLIRHLRTHNGERPYQCTICKYAFTTKANCERHVRKRHKKQNKNDIRVSMQYKHGSGNSNDALISSLNGSIQSTDNSTNNQSDQFNSNCLDNIPPSSLVETNKSLLASSNMHLIPHVFYEPNSLETSCRYCHIDFRFNRLLRQHLRTMLNNNFTKKPFNCILCNQGFTTKNICVRHFEKHHKEIPHDQIQNMIIENDIHMSTGSGSSELSNGDSSGLDQPLNLANGFYNSLNKMNNNLSEKYMLDDEDEFDEDNQDALDLSVKSNERNSIDQLSSMSRSLDLSGANSALNNQLNNANNQLNDQSDIIRNAISTLLALQSVMPKTLTENQQLVAQANSLLSGQALNTNMNNLLAAQQLQNNSSTSGSLLNLFNSFM